MNFYVITYYNSFGALSFVVQGKSKEEAIQNAIKSDLVGAFHRIEASTLMNKWVEKDDLLTVKPIL